MSTLTAAALAPQQQRDCDQKDETNMSTSANEQSDANLQTETRSVDGSSAETGGEHEPSNAVDNHPFDGSVSDDIGWFSKNETNADTVAPSGSHFGDECSSANGDSNDSLEHTLRQPQQPSSSIKNDDENDQMLSEDETSGQENYQQNQDEDDDDLTRKSSNNNIEQSDLISFLNKIGSGNLRAMDNNSQGDIAAQMHACRLCDKLLSSSSSLDRHMLTHSGERPFVCKRCHMTFTTNGNMHRHMRTHLHKDSLARQQLEQQIKSSLTTGIISSESNSPAPNSLISLAQPLPQQPSPTLLSALCSSVSRDAIESNKTLSNITEATSCSNQLVASAPIIESLASGNPMLASNGANLIAPLISPAALLASATQQQSGGSIVDGSAMTALLSQQLIAALSNQQQPAANQQLNQEIPATSDFVESESMSQSRHKHIMTTNTSNTAASCLLQQPISVSTNTMEHSSPSSQLSSASTSPSSSSPVTSSLHLFRQQEQQQQLHHSNSATQLSSMDIKIEAQDSSKNDTNDDDIMEDISQSYVKTANPNAARKGGKRNRHCYKCKLCTYSSVDRCTLVRHLRIHSGERPYICGICRYAFTTKANCERHVRKRHKKQYNSLGGGGGVKGGNGGGRSLIITDHNNHQTIPVKVNSVAAQTISQTLQRIQEKQQDNEGLNKEANSELKHSDSNHSSLQSNTSGFAYDYNNNSTRQQNNSNINSKSSPSRSSKRKQNGQYRTKDGINPQMLAEQLSQSNHLQPTNHLTIPHSRDDIPQHDKHIIDDVFGSKKLLGSTNQQLLTASASAQTPTSVASLLFNQHMGPIANALEMLSSAKNLSQQLALNPQNSFTNLLRQTPFNPIDLAAQALDLSCKFKTTK